MPTVPTVLLVTSNGVGMGHLSRQLTVALSSGLRFRTVIFSLSKALPRLMEAQREGELPELRGDDLQFEYCPSRESGWLPPHGWRRLLRQRYPSYRWHSYLRDRVLTLAGEVGASAVVFDGVVPYAGLIAARERMPGIPFVWLRRGMWKPSVSPSRLRPADHFDLVVEPGDFASEYDAGPTVGTATRTTAPISLTDVLPPAPPDEARRRLGLDPDRPVLLLAPGSGVLGSVEATSAQVLQTIARVAPTWQVAVTKQAIARHTVDGANVHLLENLFPLARYLTAFDAAVSAAGYNSVHELLPAGVPTLFIPSVDHATDDQRRRAEGVAHQGAALITDANLTGARTVERGVGALPQPSRGVADGVEMLVDPTVRDELRRACEELPPTTGGREVAALITDIASPDPATPVAPRTPRAPIIDARTPVAPRSSGSGGAPSLVFTDRPTSGLVTGADPVEHIISGSSRSYGDARRRIARWLYRPEE